MPPLPAVAGLVRVLLQYTLPGVPLILNRLFFQGTGSTTSSALNSWCSQIASNWATNVSPSMVPALTLVGVTAEDLTSTTSPVGAVTTSHLGTNSALGTAPASALVIRNGTTVRERGGHSRTYLAGVPDASTTVNGSNQWASATVTSVTANWVAFINSIVSPNGPTGYSGFIQVVPTYYHGFTVVTSPITGRARNVPTRLATPIINTVVSHTGNPIIAAQRRRNKQSGG